MSDNCLNVWYAFIKEIQEITENGIVSLVPYDGNIVIRVEWYDGPIPLSYRRVIRSNDFHIDDIGYQKVVFKDILVTVRQFVSETADSKIYKDA